VKTIVAAVAEANAVDRAEVIGKAADIIKNGGLVAFPTETVYGLGANGLDGEAVKRIYEAKGRPSDNPLILHIADISELSGLVKEIPKTAERLMDSFWPGPMTLIFKKSDIVPRQTSGGLDTVAIRFPSHPVANELIKAAGLPIAAPSANTSGKPSPTRASHVEFDLDGKVDMIIDGGACEFGLESTIVDVSGEVPCLLRPGSVTLEMLRGCVGKVEVDGAVMGTLKDGQKPKAPGMKYKHYSPSCDVVIVRGDSDKVVKEINSLVAKSMAEGLKTGVIACEETAECYKADEVLVIGSRAKTETVAANLFKLLRRCDYLGMQRVYAEGLPENELGLAIMNRLKKAAGYAIIEV
jgi:L-threonylcarbamoyladenylate synthase